MQKPKAKVRKKVTTNIPKGVAHILASFNNTIITITDTKGDTICWSSTGTVGFSGSKKSTPFAAGIAAQNAARKAREAAIPAMTRQPPRRN